MLWFVAALLSWGAAAIRYYEHDGIKWSLVAAGLACAAMGVSELQRRPRPGDSK